RLRAAAGKKRGSIEEGSPFIEHQKACRKTRAERIHQRPLPAFPGRSRCGEHAVEHEQHGRRRHVAVIAQHSPRLDQRLLPEAEGMLERGDYFGAAWMADKAVDVAEREPVAGEEVRRDIM